MSRMDAVYGSQWGTVLLAASLLSACHFGSRLEFSEDVELSSGQIIRIDRRIGTKSFGEIGGPGGWESTYQSVAAPPPPAEKLFPKWSSEAGLVPMLIDRHPSTGDWTLIATFYSCDAWYGLGRPKLPYAQFRLSGERWEQQPLDDVWLGRVANVLTDVSANREPSVVDLEHKRKRMADTRISEEYRFIVSSWHTGC